MRKSLLIAAIALVCGTMAYAQPRAIGGRLGWNTDFVYQHSLSEKTYIEFNAGMLGFSGAHVDFLHEWIWLTPDWTPKGEWNWFAGVGANVGWKWTDLHPVRDTKGVFQANYDSRPLMAGAVANIGLEFNFWFPLSLAIDYRPTIGALIGKDAGTVMMTDGTIVPFRLYTEGFFDFALSVRYLFH